ncbi:hypothetical protein WJX72_010479 [[Myrmecia] bisecta]|uniref:Uncharacterized protein n=1 Tax=[Myrmecia] bisecta TaxID=41462 RepID=A0AAW1QSK5_9CHLO
MCTATCNKATAWRLELFFKTQTELQDKVIPFLRSNSVARVNLTNKTKDDKLLDSAKLLKDALPDLDVCLHYSIKWNYVRSCERSLAALERFCEQAAQLEGCSVLLVSGGGKKRQLDTVKALSQGKAGSARGLHALPVHVAFNPYLPSEKEFQAEKKRLKAKLESGLVSGIYLQIGSDLQRLKEGLSFLQSAVEECMQSGACKERPAVHGSVFLPSKRLLTQMKFRPWNGVFLSEAYLSSLPKAEAMTKELMKIYQDFDVIPLLETAVSTAEELRKAHDLMRL